MIELWRLDFQPRLGSFITEASSLVEAVQKAWKLGCNPGGQVAGFLRLTPQPIPFGILCGIGSQTLSAVSYVPLLGKVKNGPRSTLG